MRQVTRPRGIMQEWLGRIGSAGWLGPGSAGTGSTGTRRPPAVPSAEFSEENAMETTFDPYGEELGASGRPLKDDASQAAGKLKGVATEEIRNLISDVEDLVARLADLNGTDVATLR